MEYQDIFKVKRSKTPIILQSETSECGLACCAMIAGYYDNNITIFQMREKISVSLKGLDFEGLIYCADSLGFNTRAIRVDLDEIKKVKLPAIVHFDFNHFVVLTKTSKKYIYVNDPALGECRYSYSEFSDHFTGIALEFYPNKDFKKEKKKKDFSLISLLKNNVGIKRLFIQIFFLSLSLQIFTLILPYYTQIVIDNVLVSYDFDFLTLLGGLFIALGFFRGMNMWLRGTVIIYLSSNLSINLMSRMFRRLLSLKLTYFEKRHVGDIQSRFESLNELQETISVGLISAIVDGIMAISTIIVMYIYSPLLASISMTPIIIFFIYRCLSFNSLKKTLEQQLTSKAKSDSIFLESVRGITTIKNHGMEPKRTSTWINYFVRSLNSEVRYSKINLSNTVLFESLSYIEMVIIVWVSVYLILDNSFSNGMLLAFLTFRQGLSIQAHSLIQKSFEIRLLDVHLSRISDIVLSKQEENTEGIGINKGVAELGELELKNINFRYADSEPWILRNVNIHINSKECIAIVGRSGAGKSTLLKIMIGLLSPESGEVKLNGVNINIVGLNNYRRIISVVMQEDSLFSGSIRDNITMFDPNPNEELLMECAENAHIINDINNMQMGFYSLIGDMGSSLSGGQRQKILIARALYKKPDIIFFDESTCHLDAESEININRSIKRMGITRIIIAHRDETIKLADRVIDIDDVGL